MKNQPKPIWRSDHAHHVHKALFDYCKGLTTWDDLSNLISNAKKHQLKEVSTNSHSILYDFVNIPKQLAAEKKLVNHDPVTLTRYLVELLMNHAEPDTRRILLKGKSRDHWTPLLSALYHGDVDLAIKLAGYASDLSNHFSSQQYSEILMPQNKQGYTALITAIQSSAYIDAYLSMLEGEVNSGRLNNDDYVNHLLRGDKIGKTPLHHMIKNNQVFNLQTYFRYLNNAVRYGWLSETRFRDLLMQTNQYQESPLHQVTNQTNVGCFVLYWNQVKALNLENNPNYKQFLIQPNNFRLTPLHKMAMTNNWELLTFFYRELAYYFAGDLNSLQNALNAEAKTQAGKPGIKPSGYGKANEAKSINALLNAERKFVLRTINSGNQSMGSPISAVIALEGQLQHTEDKYSSQGPDQNMRQLLAGLWLLQHEAGSALRDEAVNYYIQAFYADSNQADQEVPGLAYKYPCNNMQLQKLKQDLITPLARALHVEDKVKQAAEEHVSSAFEAYNDKALLASMRKLEYIKANGAGSVWNNIKDSVAQLLVGGKQPHGYFNSASDRLLEQVADQGSSTDLSNCFEATKKHIQNSEGYRQYCSKLLQGSQAFFSPSPGDNQLTELRSSPQNK